MAKTPRKWTGARTPSGLKRVRTAERRHAILGPRRSAAKTHVKNALAVSTGGSSDVDPQAALVAAISALDRAAKVGAIHPNAAARRKSRLVRAVNAALGGATVTPSAVTKTVGKAAAAKAAKVRIAAGKADKAKGAQTAAGKARAALTRSARTTESAAPAKAETPAAAATPKAQPKGGAKAAAKPAAKAKAPAKAAASAPAKAAAKPAAKKAEAKAPAKPAAKAKAPAKKAEPKAPAKKAPAKKADKA